MTRRPLAPLPVSSREQRQAERITSDIPPLKLRQIGAHGVPVTIKDISRTGFRVEWPHSPSVGQTFWLTLPALAPLSSKVVWTAHFEMGCRFDVPIHPAVFVNALRRRR